MDIPALGMMKTKEIQIYKIKNLRIVGVQLIVFYNFCQLHTG